MSRVLLPTELKATYIFKHTQRLLHDALVGSRMLSAFKYVR